MLKKSTIQNEIYMASTPTNASYISFHNTRPKESTRRDPNSNITTCMEPTWEWEACWRMDLNVCAASAEHSRLLLVLLVIPLLFCFSFDHFCNSRLFRWLLVVERLPGRYLWSWRNRVGDACGWVLRPYWSHGRTRGVFHWTKHQEEFLEKGFAALSQRSYTLTAFVFSSRY